MRNRIDTNAKHDRDEPRGATTNRTSHATNERVAGDVVVAVGGGSGARSWSSSDGKRRQRKAPSAGATDEAYRWKPRASQSHGGSVAKTARARDTRTREEEADVRRRERTRLTFGSLDEREGHDAAQSKTVPGGTDGKTSGRQAQMGDGISRCANVNGAWRTDGEVDEDDNQLTRLRRRAGTNRPCGRPGCAIGYLVSVDAYMNLQLANCEEWIDDKLAGNLGEVLIRCNNVLYLRQAPEEE